MKDRALYIKHLLELENFNTTWLQELKPMKNMNYVIYDDDGVFFNGKWMPDKFKQQKPRIKTADDQNYAIYDTRYHRNVIIEKAYSELMHEMFHCYQISRNINLENRPMIEGGALFVEMIFFQKYVGTSIEEQLNYYKTNMNKKFDDYLYGAEELYGRFLNGYKWVDYFEDNKNRC